MFAKAALLIGATMAASAIAHSPVGVQRRELVYALRQMSERDEIYPPTAGDLPPPVCDDGYDTLNGDGSCTCGPGRIPYDSDTCQVSPAATKFAVTVLTDAPQPIGRAITWDTGVAADEAAGGAYLCAALCAEDGVCNAFYYENSVCWKIAGDNVYASTDGSFPFFPLVTKAKRAPGQVGSVGNNGGSLGTLAAAVSGSTGCIPDLGDAPQDSLTCVCGPGRVNTDAATCAYPASAGARMARKVKRDVYEGVPW